MTSGVCSVSVDVLEGQVLFRVMTVYLASRDLHARRVERVESFTDAGAAIDEVAAFLRRYQSGHG
ncbi:hypothetical protein [Mycobacterium sp. NPDC004974]